MNGFGRFGQSFKNSRSSFRSFQFKSNPNNMFFIRQFSTMNAMKLRMAQKSVYQLQMGAFLGQKGIMGSPALMSSMMAQSEAVNLCMLTQGSDDLLSILNNMLLDLEDDSL